MTSDDAPTDAGSDDLIRYEWSDPDQPSTALVEAIAAATGRKPMNMPSLHDFVDLEALDALITGQSARTAGTITVTFPYDGIRVRIDSDGDIEIQPSPADYE